MSRDEGLIGYSLRLADNALILSQRMLETVAAQPELEEELANANFALDLIGQARMFYTYAGELEGAGRSEDDFAFMRDEVEFTNLLMLEQPNGHFGDSLVRQFLFECFYGHLLEALTGCDDAGLASIAERAVKEIRYHCRHNSLWLVRLGDGTSLSHERVQKALHDTWRFTGEMFTTDCIDAQVQEQCNGPDLDEIETLWRRDVGRSVAEATLQLPGKKWMASGGKQGRHSEHLGPLLAEMQYLHRSFPGATW